jgi:murein DD-endopeptidase MepM/ murein hydrolase activator NlpD
MIKTLCVLAVILSGMAVVAAGEIGPGKAFLFEVEGTEILDGASLDLIEGGRVVREDPNEGRYTDRERDRAQADFDRAVKEDREMMGIPSRSHDNYIDVSMFGISAPLDGPMTVTCPTGPRAIIIGGVGLYGHGGTDFRAKVGDRVTMVKTGLIEEISKTSNFGGVIMTFNIDGTKSTYMHVVADTKLKPGDVVKTGTKIASVGQNGLPMLGGILSTGPHLHYGEKGKDGGEISTTGLYREWYDPWNDRR